MSQTRNLPLQTDYKLALSHRQPSRTSRSSADRNHGQHSNYVPFPFKKATQPHSSAFPHKEILLDLLPGLLQYCRHLTSFIARYIKEQDLTLKGAGEGK